MGYKFYDGDYVPQQVKFLEKLLDDRLKDQLQGAFECYVELDEDRLRFGIKWRDDSLFEIDEVDIEGYTMWTHPDYPDEVFTDKEVREMEENNQWDTDFQPPLLLSPEEIQMLQKALPEEVSYFNYEIGP